ncbi:MAG: metal ABC transporter permease [Leptospiraceae bacterium]|nr:metal ABC transporter permease [Leptospiraceae bacterium]MCP5511363.1 metal ABC transporter permease [Leptospiraceae bacterium]
MQNLITSIDLFLPQILLGSLLGLVLTSLGVIMVLRNMSFFGITLSQVASTSLAFTLFLGIENEFAIIALSSAIIIPIGYLSGFKDKTDILLGIIFVSFGALSQLLVTLGGNVQNHLLQSYFGDILTSQVSFHSYSVYLVIFSFLMYIILYKKILFYSFDQSEYITRKNMKYIDLFFLLIITISLSVSVRLLGSFYSAAQLLIPAFTCITVFRSMRMVFIFAGLLSLLSTILGFLISLVGTNYRGEEIYFPTSSTIVVLLSLLSAFVLGMHYFIRHHIIFRKK